MTEGRTHEIRELFFRAGHYVQRLRRSAIGPLRDDTLKPGDFRTLSGKEIETLRRVTANVKTPRSGRSRAAGRGVQRNATKPRKNLRLESAKLLKNQRSAIRRSRIVMVKSRAADELWRNCGREG